MPLEDRAEHRLALKISASILAILVAVVCAIFGAFYVLKNQSDQAVLEEWLDFVLNDPVRSALLVRGKADEIDAFYSRVQRIPPQFRNLVIHFDGGNYHIYGPLALAETSELALENDATAKTLFDREIGERKFVFFGKKLPDRTIYVYASQDGELGHFSKAIAALALAILLFAIALYFVARKIAQRSFAPMKESLEMMGLYNRNIAHELRTPLAVMRSDLELVQAEHPSDHILSALEETTNMETIIHGLLFLAENRSTGKHESVSLQEIIRRKEESLEKKYPEKLLKTYLKAKTKFDGNPELISILVGILLDNAFAHSTEKSTIVVREIVGGFQVENPMQQQIPESVLQHIFEPFIKYNSAGSGLGLSMARKITEIHNWKLSLVQEDSKMIARVQITQTL